MTRRDEMSGLAIWQVEWREQQSEPPDGRPRVLAEMVVPDNSRGQMEPRVLVDILLAAGRGWVLAQRKLRPDEVAQARVLVLVRYEKPAMQAGGAKNE